MHSDPFILIDMCLSCLMISRHHDPNDMLHYSLLHCIYSLYTVAISLLKIIKVVEYMDDVF